MWINVFELYAVIVLGMMSAGWSSALKIYTLQRADAPCFGVFCYALNGGLLTSFALSTLIGSLGLVFLPWWVPVFVVALTCYWVRVYETKDLNY